MQKNLIPETHKEDELFKKDQTQQSGVGTSGLSDPSLQCYQLYCIPASTKTVC